MNTASGYTRHIRLKTCACVASFSFSTKTSKEATFDVRRCARESVNIAKRDSDIEEYADLRKPDVDESDVVPRTQTPTPARVVDRQRFPDRRQRGCDSLVQHSTMATVIVTEADISPPQHPDFFHARPHRLRLPR